MKPTVPCGLGLGTAGRLAPRNEDVCDLTMSLLEAQTSAPGVAEPSGPEGRAGAGREWWMRASERQNDVSEEGTEAGLPPTPVPPSPLLPSASASEAGQVHRSICQEGDPWDLGVSVETWRGRGSCGRERCPKLSCLGLHYVCTAPTPCPHLHVATMSASLRPGPRGALLAALMSISPGGALPLRLPGPGSRVSWAPLPGGRAGSHGLGGRGKDAPYLSFCIFPGRLS